MKYLDCVEVIVEKEKYAKEGVHKGMQGVIWLEESINGTWDVFFDLWGEHAPIGDISVKEEDLKLIPKMDARINERIKAEWEERSKRTRRLLSDFSKRCYFLPGCLLLISGACMNGCQYK